MSDTVHVTVVQDDDEQVYAYESSPGDAEGETGVYEADVSAERWAKVDEAWRTIRGVFAEIRDLAGIDPDDWRLTEPCEAWQGHEYPAQRWWAIHIPRATDAETWPQREVVTGHFDTEVEARTFLDALPDQFVIVEHRPWLIEKASLVIEYQGYDARVYECDRCGWSRESHAATPSNGGSPRA